jgi:hypothetical protein
MTPAFLRIDFTSGLGLPAVEPLAAANMKATKEKIESFLALPVGWHYGAGRAPSRDAIKNAQEWLTRLSQWGLWNVDAFPGADGEIMLSAYRDDESFELVLEPDNTVSFYHEKDDRTITSLPHKGPIDVENAIIEAAGAQWSTFDFFTRGISTQGRTDLSGWRSRTLEAAALSFSTNVYYGLAYQSASTYENIIQASPGIQQYSGSLRKIDSRLEAPWNSIRPNRVTNAIIMSME